ncbi:hypothetical protein [Pseudomonas sp. MWU13-3659]|uniref:hypothetical protein n=1 Tax=Pseudomonas sp. MWU13-3659 TaxID=2986964 RepID=UPI002074B8E9|nr:hypothetical protein [Pseudomonas sp. MWU13-3659]
MKYDSQFVDRVLERFHKSFNRSAHRWCEFSHDGLRAQAYRSTIYQKLYVLRYFPAYYLEYCILASLLKRRLGDAYSSVQIASFGCGVCPDFHALKANLEGLDFDYIGYDSCQWSTRKLIALEESDSLGFQHVHIKSLTPVDLDEVDVFIFPKSISDLGQTGGLEHLAETIAATEKHRVFFLNSFVYGGGDRDDSDLRRFDIIHAALERKGFITLDDRETTHIGRKGMGRGRSLRAITHDYAYPQAHFITCARKGSKAECQGCNVVKYPVVTNNFMGFQLLEYNRLSPARDLGWWR